MSAAQTREFVITASLLVVATVKVQAADKAELKQRMLDAFTTEQGAWAVDRFAIEEADVHVGELAAANVVQDGPAAPVARATA